MAKCGSARDTSSPAFSVTTTQRTLSSPTLENTFVGPAYVLHCFPFAFLTQGIQIAKYQPTVFPASTNNDSLPTNQITAGVAKDDAAEKSDSSCDTLDDPCVDNP